MPTPESALHSLPSSHRPLESHPPCALNFRAGAMHTVGGTGERLTPPSQ